MNSEEARPSTARTVGVLMVLAVLVGGVAALLWANLAVLPEYVVGVDGRAEISERGLAEVFSATFWYCVIGVLGGLGVGVAAWVGLRRIGWPVALVSTAMALVAGLVCWWTGELIGPAPFAERMAGAQPGDVVQISLRLGAPSALAIWVFCAVAIPLFAASLGPEMGDAGAAPDAQREDAVDAEQVPSHV